jgi:Bacterial Ig-like domain
MNLSIAAKFGLPALALAATLVACPQPEPTVDTTAPQFKSSVPANDTTAIAANVAIKIVFDEAMNKTATQGAVTFSPAVTPASYVWGNGDKELTINPPAAGWGTAASYTVTIGAGAKDVAGNPLSAAPKTFKFKATPVIVGGTKTFISTNDGNIAGDYPAVSTAASVLTTFAFNATSPSVPGTLAVGNIFDGVSRGAVRFALAGVTPAQITKATLNLDIPAANVVGTPLTTLGGLQIKGVSFGTDIAADGVDAKADFQTGDAGATDVTVSASSKVSVDVTAYVKTLVAGGNADFIIRFKTEPATKGVYVAGQSLRISSLETATAANKPTLEIVSP